MINPQLIIFAIQAGIKLGRKLNDVLVDETQERALVLPVGNLYADVTMINAKDYFRHNPDLSAVGGPYRGLSDGEKLKAYRTIKSLEDRLGVQDNIAGEAKDIVLNLHKFEQYKKGFGAKSPLQRILGTVVEIGIDYFIANPKALPGNSNVQKVLSAFVINLDDIKFAEGSKSRIVGDVLLATLRTVDEHVTLIDDDERLQALLGGVVKALIEDVEVISSPGARIRREDLVKRIASSVLRGGATAFTENIDLFIPKDSTSKTLVHSTLTQILEGIKGKEDLFTNESIELIFNSALTAVAENAELLSEKKILQELIRNTVTALTNTQGGKLFSEATVAAILQGSLEAVRDNVSTLIDPNNPQKQLLANAVGALAKSLATTLAGGGTVKDLMSKQQIMELAKVTFQEVAKHPEHLLGGKLDDERKTALAQIIGSVARALGDNPSRLITGEGFVELVQTALRVSVKNADKLIDLDSTNTRTNVLFRVIEETVTAIIDNNDPRDIVSRDVFLDISKRILPVVSANLDVLFEDSSKPVKETVEKALELASGVLENRINGENLPTLIEKLLTKVLWNELKLEEKAAVELAAREILRVA